MSAPTGGAGENWAATSGLVAVALLGEPTRRNDRELRFGRRGSLGVRLREGTWFDHEAGVGGGVIDLVMHELGGSRQDALEWLGEAGVVSTVTPTGRSGTRPAAISWPLPPSVRWLYRAAAWLIGAVCARRWSS